MITLPIKSIPLALETLGYEPATIERICAHIKEYGTVEAVKAGETVKSNIRERDIPIF